MPDGRFVLSQTPLEWITNTFMIDESDFDHDKQMNQDFQEDQSVKSSLNSKTPDEFGKQSSNPECMGVFKSRVPYAHRNRINVRVNKCRSINASDTVWNHHWLN
jgi:hypothetical protein